MIKASCRLQLQIDRWGSTGVSIWAACGRCFHVWWGLPTNFLQFQSWEMMLDMRMALTRNNHTQSRILRIRLFFLTYLSFQFHLSALISLTYKIHGWFSEAFHQSKILPIMKFPFFFDIRSTMNWKQNTCKKPPKHSNSKPYIYICIYIYICPKLLNHKPPPNPPQKTTQQPPECSPLPYLKLPTPVWTPPPPHRFFPVTRQTDDLVPLVTEALALAFQVDSSRLRNVAPWLRVRESRDGLTRSLVMCG